MAAPRPPTLLNPSPTENGTPRRRTKPSGLRHEINAEDSTPSPATNRHANTPLSTTSEPKRFSKGRKARSFLRRCKHFALKYTWTIPLVLLLPFFFIYIVNPTESNIVHPFIFLSYKQQQAPQFLEAVGVDPIKPTQYGKGLWDIGFVAFYTIVLSFTREFIMQELLRPLARYNGIKSRGKQLRFMEQMYTVIYFAVMGSAGIYIMRRTPVWYFNTRGMYELFPHKTHEAVFKFYYLFQAAYWAQQAIVMLLGLERPRKDFKELVTHHIVTLSLIALSYRFHFTYIGIAVYVTHDISDFFLALSKSLNYINSPLIGPYFGTSIAVWIYLRHYQNLRIIMSLFTEFQTVGPYELNWDTEQYKCSLSNVITFGLLASLQAINLFWLFCLLRSAYRFVVHRIAKDDRSEAEEEEVVVEKSPKTQAVPPLDRNIKSVNGSGANDATPPTKRKSAR